MRDFRLVIHLKSKLARTHTLTLDAMLGGMLFAETGNGPASGQCDIIGRWKNVPMASEMYLDSDWRSTKEVLTRSTTRQRLLNPGLLDNLSKKELNKVTTGSNSHSYDYNFMSEFDAIQTQRVVFYGRGDEVAISNLLTRHGCIGSKTARGYGEIEGFEFEDTSDELPGIIHDGELARPVPEQIAIDLGIKYRRDHGMWHNPYSPALAARFGYKADFIARPLRDFQVAA